MSGATLADIAQETALISARVDRLPKWGLTTYAKIVLVTAYFFSFYDILSVGVTLPNIAASFHLKGAEVIWPMTASLVGYIIGAVVLGRIADMAGRRTALLISVLLLAVSSVATGFSWDIISLSVFRLFVGAGIGSQIAVSATMINELSPSRQRGINLQYNLIWAAIANTITAFLVLGFLHFGAVGWRLSLGFGIFSVIPAILILWLPESPRWLAARGRKAEAETIMSNMETLLERRGHTLPPVQKPEPVLSTAASSVKLLLKWPYSGRLVVVLIFWILLYITIYSFAAFSTTMINALSMAVGHTPKGMLYLSIAYLALPVGAALPIFVMNKIHRRILIFIGAMIYAAGLLLMAVSWSGLTIVEGSSLTAIAVFFVTGLGYIYTTEIFPTSIRGSAMGIADGFGHIGGVAGPSIVFTAMSLWGVRGALGTLCVAMFICGFVVLIFGARRPETITGS